MNSTCPVCIFVMECLCHGECSRDNVDLLSASVRGALTTYKTWKTWLPTADLPCSHLDCCETPGRKSGMGWQGSGNSRELEERDKGE